MPPIVWLLLNSTIGIAGTGNYDRQTDRGSGFSSCHRQLLNLTRSAMNPLG